MAYKMRKISSTRSSVFLAIEKCPLMHPAPSHITKPRPRIISPIRPCAVPTSQMEISRIGNERKIAAIHTRKPGTEYRKEAWVDEMELTNGTLVIRVEHPFVECSIVSELSWVSVKRDDNAIL